jgi:hypothetical protein
MTPQAFARARELRERINWLNRVITEEQAATTNPLGLPQEMFDRHKTERVDWLISERNAAQAEFAAL